jgi:hypothetical protein
LTEATPEKTLAALIGEYSVQPIAIYPSHVDSRPMGHGDNKQAICMGLMQILHKNRTQKWASDSRAIWQRITVRAAHLLLAFSS